jgi:hypothetical protein
MGNEKNNMHVDGLVNVDCRLGAREKSTSSLSLAKDKGESRPMAKHESTDRQKIHLLMMDFVKYLGHLCSRVGYRASMGSACLEASPQDRSSARG